jgi:hypothetical protein
MTEVYLTSSVRYTFPAYLILWEQATDMFWPSNSAALPFQAMHWWLQHLRTVESTNMNILQQAAGPHHDGRHHNDEFSVWSAVTQQAPQIPICAGLCKLCRELQLPTVRRESKGRSSNSLHGRQDLIPTHTSKLSTHSCAYMYLMLWHSEIPFNRGIYGIRLILGISCDYFLRQH